MAKNKRLVGLDSIRGLAACAIALFYHYQHFVVAGEKAPVVFDLFYKYGAYGVEFFFGISGFVMMYVYKKKIMDGTITGLQYMKKRFLHLYPLMLITFIYVASIQFYNIKTTGICFVYTCTDLLHAVLNVFMINFGIVDTAYNFNGPAWCVPIEMLAYLLLFILIRKSEKRQDKLYLLLAGGIIVGRILVQSQWQFSVLNNHVGRGLFNFFIGCVVYEIYEYTKKKGYLETIAHGCLALCLVCGLIIFIINSDIMGDSQLFISILLLPCTILVTVGMPTVEKVLSFRPLVYLGRISYSLYMWHFPVQLTMQQIAGGLPFKAGVYSTKIIGIYIATTLICAVLSYELIEKRLVKRIIKKRGDIVATQL